MLKPIIFTLRGASFELKPLGRKLFAINGAWREDLIEV
jgi:hypothetical protein